MESIRELSQTGLGVSLEALSEEDLVALAWPVVCGTTMARRGEIVQYKEGVLQVLATDTAWELHLRSMSTVLKRELALITGVPVTEIHFEVHGRKNSSELMERFRQDRQMESKEM